MVDMSNLCWRASAMNYRLTASDGTFTGGLYGFMVSLAALIRDMEATHCVVTKDCPPYKRTELYPEYKLIRKKAQNPELKEKVELAKVQVEEALRVIGIPVLGVPGFESDDVMGHIATRYRWRFDKIIAGANDSDLNQLLWIPRLVIYRNSSTPLMTRVLLKRLADVTPEEHSLMTAMTGTHNDVAGIPGVKDITAKKIMRAPELLAKTQREHGALIERNLRLIKLPYEGFPRGLTLPPAEHFKVRELYKFFARYNIATTKPMLDSFEKVCP